MLEFIEDAPNQSCICKSDKMSSDILIKKSLGGYCFFHIEFEKGNVPNELKGKFLSIRDAQKAVELYLRNKKETVSARRENFAKAREERKLKNVSTDNPEGSERL